TGLVSSVTGTLTSPVNLPANAFVTATATQVLTHQTTEFSNAIGLFVVTNTTDGGGGSLRRAISNANAVAGANTITFAIPTTDRTKDVQTIKLTNALPDVTDEVTIDGFSQGGPTYAGTPLVEIDGSGILDVTQVPPTPIPNVNGLV